VRQLQVLKETLPGLKRVALLGDAGAAASLFQVAEAAARSLGLEVEVQKVERIATPNFGAALSAAKLAGAQALVVISTPVTTPHRKTIVELAAVHQLPTMSPRDHDDAAPLLSYGTTFLESTRRAADYAARILKGAKPADLPVQTVSAPELIVNLKTARALGVNVPQAVLLKATRVVD
jgi:putative tryptophan/tyrosine transport system substrate-binding protein